MGTDVWWNPVDDLCVCAAIFHRRNVKSSLLHHDLHDAEYNSSNLSLLLILHGYRYLAINNSRLEKTAIWTSGQCHEERTKTNTVARLLDLEDVSYMQIQLSSIVNITAPTISVL